MCTLWPWPGLAHSWRSPLSQCSRTNSIYFLFIYCHLYSALSIVQCSNALYRLWDGEIQGHTGQPSVREIDAHTMYNQWATAPGLSLNSPRPKSITHLRTFSDNGVYVALQLFLSTGALGSFTCSGMTLPIDMGPTALCCIRATGDTLSNV